MNKVDGKALQKTSSFVFRIFAKYKTQPEFLMYQKYHYKAKNVCYKAKNVCYKAKNVCYKSKYFCSDIGSNKIHVTQFLYSVTFLVLLAVFNYIFDKVILEQ